MKKTSHKLVSSVLGLLLGVGIVANAYAVSLYSIAGTASVSGTTVTLSGTASANTYTGQSQPNT
jgi:hypothetical protein